MTLHLTQSREVMKGRKLKRSNACSIGQTFKNVCSLKD